MNQSVMRKWHRRIGIVITVFIVFQAGSGLLITIVMNKLLLILYVFVLGVTIESPALKQENMIEMISSGISVMVPGSLKTEAWADQNREKNSIQWFKDEMKISPKYLEKNEGILGMSWAHFLTMVFLAAFGAGAFIVFILRYRRARELINLVKEESRHDNKD